MNDFFAQPHDKPELSTDLWALYGGTKESDTCQVFGGWTEMLKGIASTLPGVNYVFAAPIAGFLKPKVSAEGPPIIYLSKRLVKSASMYASAFQAVCDVWFTMPTVIGSLDFMTEDTNWVYDSRILASWQGFLDHIGPSAASIIGGKMFPQMVQVPFEDAVIFLSKGEQEGMIEKNPGNGIYTGYVWDDVLGPMPDFTK